MGMVAAVVEAGPFFLPKAPMLDGFPATKRAPRVLSVSNQAMAACGYSGNQFEAFSCHCHRHEVWQWLWLLHAQRGGFPPVRLDFSQSQCNGVGVSFLLSNNCQV